MTNLDKTPKLRYDAWHIKEKISKLTGQEIDILEFMNVMSFACDFYGQARYTSYGYQDDRVFDAKKIVEEHLMRPSVDYYPFTKKQLLKAGDPDHFDRTPEINSLISFLLKHYSLSDQETNKIALQITNMINADSKPAPRSSAVMIPALAAAARSIKSAAKKKTIIDRINTDKSN